MSPQVLAFCAGFALAASSIVAIGAQNLFVLQQGLKKEHVGPIVLFCSISDTLLIITGVSGTGAIISAFPQIAKAFTLAGVLFLAWYGFNAFRRATRQESMTVATARPISLGKAIASVAAFTWLNPPGSLPPGFCHRCRIRQLSLVHRLGLRRAPPSTPLRQTPLVADP